MNPLLTATDLVHWADRRPAQDMLPLLVRRLILASVNPTQIDFASGDSINRPGYDGFLQTVDGHLLVPAGQSVWEMGVDQKPANKANADYAARKANPSPVNPSETTFVFVTPRRWQGKARWAAEKRAENYWLDVRVVDAIDLDQWLDRCLAVAAWARRQIIGLPDGLHDLEERWESWASRTAPRLVPEVFTAGRNAQVDQVRGWLAGPPACLRIRADSSEEAVGFIAAVTQLLDEASRERVLSRGLVVTTPEAWRAVAGQNTPVTLIATSPFGSEAQAVANRHHVAVAYGNDSDGVRVNVRLPHLRRADLEAVLRRMNLDDDRCRDLAAESRGRVAAVVDLLGGGTVAPHWAAPAVAPQLVPFLLAGSWCQNSGDLEAVARLSRTSSDEVLQRLSRWANETDPPVRLVGGMWEWVSRQRAWPHLARHVTSADLTAFRLVAADVLGEVDPRLDLAPDQRWMAAIHNCAPRYSEPLRRGLAEALAILAAHPKTVCAGTDPTGLVNVVVRELFGPSPDPHRWYSLAPVLPLLAEVAPDVFLTAVERDPVADPPVRAALLQEEGLFGGSRHCHLLWALETLAWSPEHLSRTAVALGGLAANGVGGRTGNRPQESLRTIFLAWNPHTTASVLQRLAAIDAVNRHYPDVAFDLCLKLLPSRHDYATPTSRPRWRPWAVDHEDDAPRGERREYVLGLYDRALNWAGGDPSRWARLLDPVPSVPREQLGELIARVGALPLEQFADSADDVLRRTVRRILHRKRTIEGIYSEITDEFVACLEAVYVRLEPSDPVRRHAWLFDTCPDLLSVVGSDWRAEEEARERERRDVIREFVEQGATDQLLQLADYAGEPGAVGYHVGQSELADEVVTDLLTECLGSESEKRQRYCQGMIWGRFRRDGWPWVERVFRDDGRLGWPPARMAMFSSALPFETATWDWIEALGEDMAAEYWQTRSTFGVSDPQRDAPRAIQTLLDRGRPFAAFHIAGMCVSIDQYRGAVTPELLFAVLQAMTAVARGEVQTAEGLRLDDDLGYHLCQILNTVETAGVASELELAQIEWVWLPALERTERGLATLHRLLARDPAFFAQVVGFIYRPRHTGREDEPVPEPDELARARGTQAFRLLHEWRGVPGVADGGLNPTALQDWVAAARQALQASGHAEVGDEQIGELLARVPAGAGDVWPHESVRELLEDLRSEAIEEGVVLGVVNSRGATMRSPHDGGELEMALAERYATWADALTGFPRTARVLRQLAEHYRDYARREDDRRDLNEFYR